MVFNMKTWITLCLSITACSDKYDNRKQLVCQDDISCTIVDNVTDRINQALGCEMVTTDATKGFTMVTVEKSTEQVKAAQDRLSDPSVAAFYQNNQIYFDNAPIWFVEGNQYIQMSSIDADTLLVLHELGHAFGLGHEPDSIMNKQAQRMTIDDAINSLAHLLYVHGLSYCH